jgi:hypothetical protein
MGCRSLSPTSRAKGIGTVHHSGLSDEDLWQATLTAGIHTSDAKYVQAKGEGWAPTWNPCNPEPLSSNFIAPATASFNSGFTRTTKQGIPGNYPPGLMPQPCPQSQQMGAPLVPEAAVNNDMLPYGPEDMVANCTPDEVLRKQILVSLSEKEECIPPRPEEVPAPRGFKWPGKEKESVSNIHRDQGWPSQSSASRYDRDFLERIVEKAVKGMPLKHNILGTSRLTNWIISATN